MHVRWVIGAFMVLALVLPSTTVAQTAARPTNDELARTAMGGQDWITYGGALNNERYSSLDQVNTSNVQNLKGAWMTRLGSGKGSKYRFEADPIVLDGVMYIPTGNDDIFALDAKTGKKLWEWDSDIPQTNDLICCGWDNRGVAVGEGRVYSGLLDGSFVALDQQTGKVVWRTQLEDYHDGYSITGAFRYYDGMIFTGMSGAENGVRGRVYGLDAKTGQVMWTFYTIPAPGEFGSDTWPSPNDPDPERAQAWTHGGATVWQAPAIDPELGMIYFSTGNAGPDYDGSVRPGDNLFAASIVALDYKTGQYKWHFQQARHDIWDFDAPSPTVLFDQTYNGQLRKGIFEPGKTGWVYFLDRTNGQPLIGIDYKAVPQEPRQATAETQPYPVGDPFITQCPDPVPGFPLGGCIFTPFWDVPTLLIPTGHGGSEWSPSTYSPQTGYAYVMGSQQDNALAMRKTDFEHGKTYSRSGSVTPLGAPIKNTFTAIDSRTNKIVWQQVNDGDQSYGAMSTAGGLVFKGQIDGNLVALDARTGDQLWKFQTGWGVSAPPMTYMIDGVQYVTVASGGNRGGLTTLDGDAVWTFSLNGVIDQVAAPPPIQTKQELTGRQVKLGDMVGNPQQPGGDRLFDGAVETLDYDYLPRRATVPAGTTVSWTNTGSTIHTATAQNGGFDTGDISPGQTVSVTLNTPGTYVYNCLPHPWMVADIQVT